MNNGEKIASLRKAKGMTQAELGAELNVTFQAVSKWERGESYPDFDTMSRLAKLFGVPLSYFENDEDGAQETAAAVTSATAAETEPQKVMLGVCKECGMTVYEGEEAAVSPALVCKKCAERKKQEAKRAEEEAIKQRNAAEQAKLDETHKIRNRGLIWAGIIIGLITVFCIVGMVASPENLMYTLIGLAVVILFGYTFVAQLFWDGVICEIVMFGGKIVGMPGVIFTLDLDGMIFLIVVKILFAVIKFIIWLATFLVAAVFALIISPFTFPFALRKLNRGEEL